jgi:hypothetical protein
MIRLGFAEIETATFKRERVTKALILAADLGRRSWTPILAADLGR